MICNNCKPSMKQKQGHIFEIFRSAVTSPYCFNKVLVWVKVQVISRVAKIMLKICSNLMMKMLGYEVLLHRSYI